MAVSFLRAVVPHISSAMAYCPFCCCRSIMAGKIEETREEMPRTPLNRGRSCGGTEGGRSMTREDYIRSLIKSSGCNLKEFAAALHPERLHRRRGHGQRTEDLPRARHDRRGARQRPRQASPRTHAGRGRHRPESSRTDSQTASGKTARIEAAADRNVKKNRR